MVAARLAGGYWEKSAHDLKIASRWDTSKAVSKANVALIPLQLARHKRGGSLRDDSGFVEGQHPVTRCGLQGIAQ